ARRCGGGGQKMCGCAGAEGEGVFLRGGPRGSAGPARGGGEGGGRGGGREPPPVLGYVRTAVGANAEGRLAKDEAFYRDLHPGYRKHFDRQGAPEGTVGVAGENASVIQQQLSHYRALDVTVVRALASATTEDMSALAEAAGPGF